ncbi:hypothetical protein [Paraclostridium bifermentans]|uniref:hypothetical protein n=1 Tax=Paraclostridium bifermentans TaxID=1490 RepID=UPI0018A90D21|nr:hypothetical protein [Paraclostridium bifermentans]
MKEKQRDESSKIIKEILFTESNISKSFDELLNKVIVNEFDSISDYNNKLNLIKDILGYYNERTYLVQKILSDYLNLIEPSQEFKDFKFKSENTHKNYINTDLEKLKVDDDYEIIDRCSSD